MSRETYAPLGGRLVTPVTVTLALLAITGFFFLAERFLYGMGAVSNLNNGYAWGVWIVFDVLIGTGFACGGYAMALLVYVFNKHEFHPLLRPALTASLMGYALGGFAVIVDLGRWWNFWHLLWPGYAHVDSVMFEVGVCITLYIIVMFIEFSPILLERLGLNGLKGRINKVMFFFIALGVLLPSMHQSSLGSMLIVMGDQVDPVYQTVMLPLLYVLSALCMGLAIVMFEATISAEGFHLPRETRILGKAGHVLAWVIVAFLIVRFGDLFYRGVFMRVMEHRLVSYMFWAETALFVLAAWMMSVPALRGSPRAIFIAAISMLAAASLYRIDSFFVAYNPGPQAHYFPAIPEMMITIGLFSFEVLAIIIMFRLLPVFPAHARRMASG